MSYVENTLRRERNNYLLAAFMFAATSGGALWIANSMDEGEAFDAHGRVATTAIMQSYADTAEKMVLGVCALFTVISGLNFHRRSKKYEEAKEWAASGPKPS